MDAPGERRTFTYDSCTRGRGLLCSATRTEGSTTLSKAVFTYTPQGQVASRVDTGSGANDASGYAYDGMGRLTRVSYPSGLGVNYVYSAGRLSSITADLATGSTQGIANEFVHDVTGAVVGWRYANGIVHRRERDLDGRIAGISSVYGSTVHQSLTYGYNPRDLITAITDGVDAAASHQYGYDELGRLTYDRVGGSSETWDQFDAIGNRIERTRATGGEPGPSNFYEVDPHSSRMSAMSGNANRSFQYSAHGNLTATSGWLGDRTFAYDGFNRMKSSTAGGVATSYVVNALDQRMRKAGPLGTFRYVYSGQNTLLAQHEPNGWKSFVYLGGQPIAMVSTSSTRYFIHTDHLSRPELVTNTSRQAVWKGSRGTYSTGVVLNNIGTGIPMGFPGQVWDEETQTWHNGFRDYDPYTGRYIQSDPIGLGGGVNTYAYVGGNPISLVDPLGLKATCKCTDSGAQININFKFSGPDAANAAAISAFRSSIESNWSAPGFSVTTSIGGWGATKINLVSGSGRSFMQGNKGTWYTGENPWVGAHEAGHVMRLNDRYTQDASGKTTPQAGWEGTIMAQHLGAVTPADRQGVLDALGCNCQCGGGQ